MDKDRCPTCGRQHTRSNAQNALYWSTLHAISDKVKPSGKSYSAETWSLYFRQRYLGEEEKKLPNGKVISEPRHTSELDKEEMTDYLNKIIVWAAEREVYADDN